MNRMRTLREKLELIGRVELESFRPRWLLAATLTKLLPQFTFNFTRTLLLRAGGLSIGERSLVLGEIYWTGEGHRAGNISIGVDTVITGPLYANLGADVTIGDRVRIGHRLLLLTVSHEIGKRELRCGPQILRPITIGNGVWIGSRVTILPGVAVGEGSVIASGAVVTRDVEPDTLVGGVPARVIRRLDPA